MGGDRTMHTRMLGVARRVLDARAALDGHAPGGYDAAEEGYVASVLNALRQWSAVHGVEWAAELEWADACFARDMAGVCCVSDLACPVCGHAGSFTVVAGVAYLMHADGEAEDRDEPLRWDAGSVCACPGCGHRGKVRGFLKRDKEEGKEETMGNRAYLDRTKFTRGGEEGWGWCLGDDHCRGYTDHFEEGEVPSEPLALLAKAAEQATGEEVELLENLLRFGRGICIDGSWFDAEAVAPVIERALAGEG